MSPWEYDRVVRPGWLQILFADLGIAFVFASGVGLALGSATNGVIGFIAAVVVDAVGARIAFTVADGYRRLR